MKIDPDEHPLVQAFRARDELSRALSRKKWKRARSRAVRVRKIIQYMRENRYPHYDGLFCVGEQQISKAPEDAREAVLRMNDVIREIPKSKSKKTKKK